MSKSFSESYKAAGVDITAGYKSVELMKKHIEWEWFEDDTPVDLSEFENMSREELEAEISELEAEAIKERDRIRREEALASV